MSLIFSTVHGSRLYGLEHAASDYDYYSVWEGDGLSLRQTTSARGLDSVNGSLKAFLHRANTGSHQSLEALFSPVKEWATPEMRAKWEPMIESYYVGGGEVFAKYERTIRKFSYGDFKRRRHAVRLYWNLIDMRQTGRFNPRLAYPFTRWVNDIAAMHEGDELAVRLGVFK